MAQRVIKYLMMGLFLFAISASYTGCKVQKNDFHRKKYKIKKGQPPAQRYYNKHSLFRPRN